MKQLTQQIINQADNIVNYINSELYRNQLMNHDILSENSPYKQGDHTLGESIEVLKKLCQKIKISEKEIDSISFDVRTNIINYLQSVYQSLQNGLLGNWPTIINYTMVIQQSLFGWGVNILDTKNAKDIEEKIKNINIKDDEILKIKKLREELELVRAGAEKIEQAKSIIDTINKSKYLKDIEQIRDDTERYSKALSELKKETDKYIIVSHFSELKDRYMVMLFGHYFKFNNLVWGQGGTKWEWAKLNLFKNPFFVLLTVLKNVFSFFFFGIIKYLIYSVILFVLNIYMVIHFRDSINLTIENPYLELVANGSIRLICLLPSIVIFSLILDIYKRAYILMERYEFKSVISYALPGVMLELKSHLSKDNTNDNKTLNSFLEKTANEIFSNPLEEKIKEEDIFLKNLSENISLFEKIKTLFK